METGIEPVCTALQAVASPLGHSTVALPPLVIHSEVIPDGVSPEKIRADDGTRTRDPHLGKVMRYQLRYIRTALPLRLPGFPCPACGARRTLAGFAEHAQIPSM